MPQHSKFRIKVHYEKMGHKGAPEITVSLSGGNGGRSRNRTGVTGFAVPCITTMLSGHRGGACGAAGGNGDIGPGREAVNPGLRVNAHPAFRRAFHCIGPEMQVYSWQRYIRPAMGRGDGEIIVGIPGNSLLFALTR